jgi:sarcosine oxidase subunit gamma
MPVRFDGEPASPPVALADVSAGLRAGLKGPGAAAWLAGRGVAVPARPNHWIASAPQGLVARLGDAEFLLEDMAADGQAGALAAALATASADVYPVLRQDVSLLLFGAGVADVLLETCSLDFRCLAADRGDLALASMIGVPVLILPLAQAPPAYRIWADPSFGPYLWETLLEIVRDHGGGAAGWARAGAMGHAPSCSTTQGVDDG